MIDPLKRAAPLLLLAALAGCGGGALRSAGDLPAPAATAWSGRADVGRAIELLNQGKPKDARKLLAATLKRQPTDPIATGLLRQIDADPMILLGAANYPYTVRAGETLADLAGRFLGNPTSFYALGRYNGLTFPVTLTAGQTLLIPGEPKVERPRPAPERAKPASPARRPESAKPLPPLPAAKPAADAARATRLRAAALEQLNRGAVDRAVTLLRQAAQAAPDNALIRRDLDRALRIQRTVRR